MNTEIIMFSNQSSSENLSTGNKHHKHRRKQWTLFYWVSSQVATWIAKPHLASFIRNGTVTDSDQLKIVGGKKNNCNYYPMCETIEEALAQSNVHISSGQCTQVK